MSFLNKIKETSLEITRKAKEEYKKREEIKRQKKLLLNPLTFNELKRVYENYTGESPRYHEDPITGEKRRLVRADYINALMSKLTVEQIEKLIEKSKKSKKNKKRKETKEEKRINSKKINRNRGAKDKEFEKILKIIKNDYQNRVLYSRDVSFSDEKQFRDNLYSYLVSKYPNKSIKLEQSYSKGKIDILVNGKYVLELKYAQNPASLNAGLKEVKNYKKEFKNIAVIILDVNKLKHERIKEYKEDYEEDGAKVIILKGNARSKKKKVKYTLLKQN